MRNAHTLRMSKTQKDFDFTKKNRFHDFSELFFEIIILVILDDFDKFDAFAQKFAEGAKFSI